MTRRPGRQCTTGRLKLNPASASAGGAVVPFSATATDQFGNAISSPSLNWGVTAGSVDSSGNFTPPSISEPCELTVTGGTASASEAVKITNPSPLTSGRLGNSWIQSMFAQALGTPGSTGTAATHVGWLSNGTGVAISFLGGWIPGGAYPLDYVPGGSGSHLPSSANGSFNASPPVVNTPWGDLGTSYTTSEDDWTTGYWTAYSPGGQWQVVGGSGGRRLGGQTVSTPLY
jgi:hypothetical protein